MSPTRATARLEVARLLAGPHLVAGTTTGNGAADGTTFIDATYASTLLQDGHFVGFPVYLTSGTYSGEWRRIASYVAASGTFTVDRAFTGQIVSGVGYEIHPTLNPILIHEGIDRALRRMLYPFLAIPSLVADADMEASGTTSYTAGTGATLAKVTTAANVFRGVQSMSVTADATGNRYAYQRLNGVAGDEYFVWAACQNSLVGTQCKLVAYDYTNGAEITSETSTQMEFQALGFTFTLPASCEQFEIRLQTITASGVSYWDHVQLLRRRARRYAMPSWVTEKWQVGRLVYQLEGTNLIGDGTMLDEQPPTRYEHMRVKKEGPTVYIAPSPAFANDRPVFLECLRHYAALSTDASTTDADLDWLVTKAKYECLRTLAAPLVPGEERREFQKALDQAKIEAIAMDARFMPHVDYKLGFGDEALFALAEAL